MDRIVQDSDRIQIGGDRYRIIQFLGSGGNCQVFLAMATTGKFQGILFALKFFMNSDDKERLTQFIKEKEFLLKTDHPTIMKIYAEGEHYSLSAKKLVPVVVADYFPDRLDHRLRNNRLRLSEKLIYVMQLLSALQYLESLEIPIVHRDIKPQNIFLKGYTCVLGDFGLMKDLSTELQDGNGDIFKHSAGAGMPRFYRTPDLVNYANQKSSITTASDIFQLGLVAAEMFTGRNPLKYSKDLLSVVEIEDLKDIPGQNGKLLKDIINKMLIFDPEHRGKITDLLDGFDGVLLTTTSKLIEIDDFAF